MKTNVDRKEYLLFDNYFLVTVKYFPSKFINR